MWLTCGGDRRYLFVGKLTVAACSASISRHFALRKLKTGSDPNVVQPLHFFVLTNGALWNIALRQRALRGSCKCSRVTIYCTAIGPVRTCNVSKMAHRIALRIIPQAVAASRKNMKPPICRMGSNWLTKSAVGYETRKTEPKRNKNPGSTNAIIRLKLRFSESNIDVSKSDGFHRTHRQSSKKNQGVTSATNLPVIPFGSM